MKDINVRANYKNLRKHMTKTSQHWTDNDFLDTVQRTQAKKKIEKLDFIKI